MNGAEGAEVPAFVYHCCPACGTDRLPGLCPECWTHIESPDWVATPVAWVRTLVGAGLFLAMAVAGVVFLGEAALAEGALGLRAGVAGVGSLMVGMGLSGSYSIAERALEAARDGAARALHVELELFQSGIARDVEAVAHGKTRGGAWVSRVGASRFARALPGAEPAETAVAPAIAEIATILATFDAVGVILAEHWVETRWEGAATVTRSTTEGVRILQGGQPREAMGRRPGDTGRATGFTVGSTATTGSRRTGGSTRPDLAAPDPELLAAAARCMEPVLAEEAPLGVVVKALLADGEARARAMGVVEAFRAAGVPVAGRLKAALEREILRGDG